MHSLTPTALATAAIATTLAVGGTGPGPGTAHPAPLATLPSITGRIVACCTLASMRTTTRPPRWIRPRIGGLSFASVPRPGAPASLRQRPSRPF